MILVCLHAEKDTNYDVLWVWSYPGVAGEIRNLLMRKCNLGKAICEEGGVLQFMFGHFLQIWYYFLNFKVGQRNLKFPKVSLSVVIYYLIKGCDRVLMTVIN